MKVAIAIPFKVSSSDAALRLCLRSLRRHAGIDYELFLMLDTTGQAAFGGFDPASVERLHPGLRIRRADKLRPGHHKQTLVNWLCEPEHGLDVVFVMHADVFLYKDGLLPAMLAKMAAVDAAACYWEVPLLRYEQLVPSARPRRLSTLMAPRVSSWLFCLRIKRYLELEKKVKYSKGLFLGHRYYQLRDPRHPFAQWVRAQPEYPGLGEGDGRVFADVGSYYRYAVEKLRENVAVMGRENYQNQDDLDLYRHQDGFVHISQFNPARYAGTAELAELFVRKEKQVREILEKEYGDRG